MIRKCVLLMATVTLAACAATDSVEQAPYTLIDSAGIQIVESRRPLWSEGEGWVLDSVPLLEVALDELYRVRGAYLLPDRRLVVANGGSLQIIIFDPDGRPVRRLGGPGSGPGEFRDFTRVRRSSDGGLMIFDFTNGRVTRLHPDSAQPRVEPLPELPGGHVGLPEDVFGDGGLLVTPAGGPPTGNGLTRRQRALWRIAPDGNPTQLAEFAELEMYFFDRVPRPIAFREPFFGVTAYYTAGQDRLIWGDTERFVLYEHALDGRLTRLLRLRQPTRSYGPADVRVLTDRVVSAHRNEEARPALRAVLSELPREGSVPMWGWPDYARSYGPALIMDDDGVLWVAEYHMPSDDHQHTRTVIASNGAWLGTVPFPSRFSPWHIGHDFIVGIARDEFDVESIRVYRLRRGSDVRGGTSLPPRSFTTGPGLLTVGRKSHVHDPHDTEPVLQHPVERGPLGGR